MADQTWSTDPVPAETVAVVRASLEPLVDGIIAAIRAESPSYAQVLGSPEGIALRLGIEQAIKTFLDAVERGERPAGDAAELWRRLGEAEFQAGRGLDALRSAFRTGTRAAWRGAADLAAEAGVSAPIVIDLAEAIFVYSDELAGDVVEGYLRMQSDQAGERERRRRRLAALLLDPDGHDPEAIERGAELARWTVPLTLAVLALASEDPGAVTRRLDLDVLTAADGDGVALVIPDPDGPGRAASLQRALAGVAAAIGPAVAPRDAHRSLRWARRTLELVQSGALPDERPTRTDEHLTGVILLGDEELARELIRLRLSALDDAAEADRERLLETLGAWLAHQRHTPRIAAELHVHPQTVRYRIGKLHELLGESLDTPQGRFELEVALRARRALGEQERGR